MNENDKQGYLWVLGAASLVAFVVVAWGERFLGSNAPSPIFLQEARAVMTGAKSGVAFPLGYVAVLVAGLSIAGMNGVMLLQSLIYVGAAVAGYQVMRLCGLRGWHAIAGALVVVAHPQAMFAIRRVVDTAIVYPMIVTLVFLLVLLRSRPVTWVRVVALGCLLGAAFATRPNLVLLLPVLVWILRGVFDLRRWAIVLATALAAIVAITTPFAGRPVLASNGYGAYTFFVGANEYTAGALLDGNIELSVRRLAGAGKLPFEGSDIEHSGPEHLTPEETGQLFDAATTFVREHPFEYAGLAGLKLTAMFRPDLGDSTHPLEPIVQIVSALPIAVWLVVRLWLRRDQGIFPIGTVLLLAATYLLPFLLTAAIQRHRYPLDALFLLDAAVAYWGPRSSTPRSVRRNLPYEGVRTAPNG